MLMTFYVDDLLLASNSLKLMEIVKNVLKSRFEMSDPGSRPGFLDLR